MSKPVVHYVNALYPIQIGTGAAIDGVNDHYNQANVPSYGDMATMLQVVYTSEVVSHDPATGDFETKNTQYVKADAPVELPLTASHYGLMNQ